MTDKVRRTLADNVRLGRLIPVLLPEIFNRLGDLGYPLGAGVMPSTAIMMHVILRVAYEHFCALEGRTAEPWDWPIEQTYQRIYGTPYVDAPPVYRELIKREPEDDYNG